MRGSHALLAILAFGAIAAAAGEHQVHKVPLTDGAIHNALSNLFDLAKKEGDKVAAAAASVHDKAEAALEKYAQENPDSLVAKALGVTGERRRLQTVSDRIQNVQAFFEDILGGSWRTLLPSRWANATNFDWGRLGDFEYGSSLGDFLETHDLASLANITSVHDLAHNIDAIEGHFCEPESFTPSAKVPAACSGPTVTIALVPKVCILEAKDKQIVCDPAKLVLRKTPGSCVHKHKSASTWAGKECKISGSAGFSDELVIGGGEKSIPLIDINIGYEFKRKL